ncbi:MAG: hypothetical protein GY812_04830 [Actinomycetia bacterium]|nr:hypothetical protein [Actinomycetes bacterium]
MGLSLDTVAEFDTAEVADLLRRRGRVRGEPVAISLFESEIPPEYGAKPVEPCAIVREAMDFGHHVYVDAEHHACLAGAWQAGFIEPPAEISSGKYLATHTDFFTEEGARVVKNGNNVLPQGTARAIGACPLDQVPAGVAIDVVVVVCDPSIAAMVGGVRVAVDGTPPTGAAGTSLCGDLFALPWHEPNVVVSTGDVGGRMFNKIKPHEMFVIIPARWVHMVPEVLGSRPDLTGLLDSIKPGYAAEREAKREARAAAGEDVEWEPEALELLAAAPEPIRDFAGPTMEEYAREHGHHTVTVEVIAKQMESIGMRLEDVLELGDDEAEAALADRDEVGDVAGREAAEDLSDLAATVHEPADEDDLGPGRVRSHATRLIPTDAAQVWEVIADVGGWGSWYSDIRDVRMRDEVGHGAKMRFSTGPVKVSAEVSRFEHEEVLEFVGRSKGSTSTYRFHLHARPEGTLVTLRQVTDGIAARTMRPVLQRIADTSLPQWLEALHSKAATDPEGGSAGDDDSS